jgi:tetratricopeptide (TPR) repeat protein
MLYADLEVFVQQLPGGDYAIDLRFRAESGDMDRDLAVNVPVKFDLLKLLDVSYDPQGYGAELAASIFSNQRLREAWITARASAAARQLPLRVRLRLDPDAPELHGIRWEAILDEQGGAMARSERFLLSRYFESADMTPLKLPTRAEVTALLVVASPANLAQYNLAVFDAAAEVERVRLALSDILAATLVTGDSSEHVTLTAIVDALRYGSYSILYLVCHGKVVDGVAYLALENDAGAVTWVAGDELVARLQDLRSEHRPTLVVIGSCQSVGTSHASTVPAALGPQLARVGIAAVIGMQGDLPMPMLARLMPRFFKQLVEDGQIDRALAVARTGLAPEDPWWMPVLFLRVRDGRLWHDRPAVQAMAAPVALVAPQVQPQADAPEPARAARLFWGLGTLGLLLLVGLALFTLLTRGTTQNPPPMAGSGTQSPVIEQAMIAVPTPAATLSPELPTVTPAAASSPELPSATPMSTVVPVADGKYMVLVADLEQQGAQPRDDTREIFEDLQRSIEQLPFSNLEIRRLHQVVSSDTQARSVAEAARAAVVVWGRSDDSRIELQVQAGDLSLFPATPQQISANIIRRTTTLPLRINNLSEDRPSLALAVFTVINVLYTADGDSFNNLRLATMQERLQGQGSFAEAVGQSSAVRAYQFVNNYYNEATRALELLTDGLDDDPGNPILYAYRAITYQRLGNLQAAAEDARAALLIVPNWASAENMLVALAANQADFVTVKQALDRSLSGRPDDWLLLSYRAMSNYMLNDYPAAQADAERAIALGPETALPYMVAISTALREGRVEEARLLVSEVRRQFGGRRGFDSSFYQSTFGGDLPLFVGVSAFELILNQLFSQALRSVDQGLVLAEQQGYPPAATADFYFMQGFAFCNQGNYLAADEAYSAALERAPDFVLVHILRAEARNQLGDVLGALQDLNAAASSPQAAQLAGTIQAAQTGQLSCRNVFE